jgi:hypothetical protein
MTTTTPRTPASYGITSTSGGGSYTYTITLPSQPGHYFASGGAGSNFGWTTYEPEPITITVDGENHTYKRAEAEQILKWHHRLMSLIEDQPAVGDAYERLLAVIKLVSENNNETE